MKHRKRADGMHSLEEHRDLPSTGKPTVNKVCGVTYTHLMLLLMVISEGLFSLFLSHQKLEIS